MLGSSVNPLHSVFTGARHATRDAGAKNGGTSLSAPAASGSTRATIDRAVVTSAARLANAVNDGSGSGLPHVKVALRVASPSLHPASGGPSPLVRPSTPPAGPPSAPPAGPPSTPPGQTTTSGPTSGLSLAYASTFAGTSLDTSQWTTCFPWFSTQGAGCTNFGSPQEVEWYLASQDQVSGGALHVVASTQATSGWTRTGSPKTYSYRSGMVTTYRSFDFTYGYVQIVAKLPGGAGTWPALWLLPQTQAWPPEIDIMENWGTANSFRATLHWGTSPNTSQAGQTVTVPVNLTSTYNTYGLLWRPGALTWYFNGAPVYSITGSQVPSQPMYFLANLAIDGPIASTPTFDIRSVQIYDSP